MACATLYNLSITAGDNDNDFLIDDDDEIPSIEIGNGTCQGKLTRAAILNFVLENGM